MNEILNFLITVKDDREPWKVKHLLSDIVLLVFFARLSGVEYWDDLSCVCRDIFLFRRIGKTNRTIDSL